MGKAEDFRRQHLSEWESPPWTKLAHDTWTAYDKEATSRERWTGQWGQCLSAPRMGGPPLPPGYRGGFGGLWALHVQESFVEAQDLGFTGSIVRWGYLVKLAGKFLDRTPRHA